MDVHALAQSRLSWVGALVSTVKSNQEHDKTKEYGLTESETKLFKS
ncbi:hypothetical protein [Acinetobacter sp. NIPH 2699]|nr:hypothetical protein [Acinetobacter sp. NIPH 2699]MCH7335026.1 hypothetical protein [Acinetobacter sp. NIPH 2699]